MTHDLNKHDDEQARQRSAAQVAFKWLLSLAQMESKNHVSINGMKLDVWESAGILTGKVHLDAILEERALKERDYQTYFLREMGDLAALEEQKKRDQSLPAVRHLPSASFSKSLRDQSAYDIKCEIHAAEEREMDNFSRSFDAERLFKGDSELSPKEKAEAEKKIKEKYGARRDFENNYGYATLSPADKLLWVVEARDHFEKGALYIKTTDGKILPAWEQRHIEKDGTVVVDERVDNRPLSCDETFYDEHGHWFYAGRAKTLGPDSTSDEIMADYDRCQDDRKGFKLGTPRFYDITEGALVDAVNHVTTSLATDRPVLAMALVADAAPLLHGLKMPDVKEDVLKKSFLHNKLDISFDIFPLAILEKMAEEKGLTGDLNDFIADAEKLSETAKNKINGQSGLDAPLIT